MQGDAASWPPRCCCTYKNGLPCRFPGVHSGSVCGVHARMQKKEPTECAICLSDIGRKSRIKLRCGHEFHLKCARSWLIKSLTCPLCRSICIEEVRHTKSLSSKLRLIMQALPPPPRAFFPAYIVGLVNTPAIVEAMAMQLNERHLILDLAYQSFTEDHFFGYLRQLRL